ncbi:MAG: rare lipoprotein [Enterovirga sp.]|nr:rare lipoprotein [Enterovirga sp.]
MVFSTLPGAGGLADGAKRAPQAGEQGLSFSDRGRLTRSSDWLSSASSPLRASSRQGARVAAAVLIGLTVANCASTKVSGGRNGNKYGVAASPKVIPDGEPVPKGGGRAMVGKPYVVGGRTYVPVEARNYSREGWSSWYGTAFHGRLTANGEIFDRESIAAAHPTLPLPSYVRVTNVANRRSMVVRVNDRGPYERDRLIDVSERVAEALDFRQKGTARLKVDYLGKASINGSDDEKLLATLTVDGRPAALGGSRTMLADLREEAAPRPASTRVADAVVDPAPDSSAEDDPAPVPPRVTSPRVQLAAASLPEEARQEEVSPMPPERPAEFGGKPRSTGPVTADAAASPSATVGARPPRRSLLAEIY